MSLAVEMRHQDGWNGWVDGVGVIPAREHARRSARARSVFFTPDGIKSGVFMEAIARGSSLGTVAELVIREPEERAAGALGSQFIRRQSMVGRDC